MKHRLYIGMMLIVFPINAYSTETTYTQNQSATSSPWALCIGVALGIGIKSCYDRFFHSSDNQNSIIPEMPEALAIPSKTIDKTTLQQKLEIDLKKLTKTRELFNSAEMAGKRAERNRYYEQMQQLVKGSYRFLDPDIHECPDPISLECAKNIEEKLKAKINEVYRSHREKPPVYDSDDQLRTTTKSMRSMSVTSAEVECREQLCHLNELRIMRIKYTDLADEINRPEIKIKSLETKIENLKTELTFTGRMECIYE